MRAYIAVPALLLALLLFSTPSIHGISSPNYLTNIPGKITPGEIKTYGKRLVIHSPAAGELIILNPETGETKEITAPRYLKDLAIKDDLAAVLPLGGENKVIIYNLKTGEKREEVRLPGEPEDLTSSKEFFWIAIPRESLIYGYNPSTREERQVRAGVEYGEGVIACSSENLWILLTGRKSLLKVDLRTGEKRSIEMGEEVVALQAYSNGVIIATESGKIMKIKDNLRIEKTWKLERGVSVETLYYLSDGRILYVSPSRWIIGEIDGEQITERKVNGRIGASDIAGDRIWFTETNTGRIGWLWFSRPPKIEKITVEPILGRRFKAQVQASDPDKDLKEVVLVVLIEAGLPGIPPQNYTYTMEPKGNGEYYLEFEVKAKKEAQVYAVAIDDAMNIGRSERITIKPKIEEKTTIITTSTPTTQTTQRTGPQFTLSLTDLYFLGSSLLLLLPLAAAIIFYRKRGRKKVAKKKRKK